MIWIDVLYLLALALLSSGRLDLRPLIADTFAFRNSVAAFDLTAAMPTSAVEVWSILKNDEWRD